MAKRERRMRLIGVTGDALHALLEHWGGGGGGGGELTHMLPAGLLKLVLLATLYVQDWMFRTIGHDMLQALRLGDYAGSGTCGVVVVRSDGAALHMDCGP
jgi:hypothetical protein